MRSRGDTGTITLWMLGLCLLLFALGGISLDLWRGFSTRRSLAAVADAAALAGASAIDEDAYRNVGEIRLDPTRAEARAREHLDRQLDRGALRAVAVSADRETVAVSVDGALDFTLLAILDPGGDLRVRAHRGGVAEEERMKRVRVVATMLVSVSIVAASTIAPVSAQTGGELGPDYVRASASDLGPGTFGGRDLPAVPPTIDPPFTWSRSTTGAQCVVFGGPIPADLADAVLTLPGIEPIPGSPVQVGTLQGAQSGAVWLEPGALVPASARWSAPFAVDAGTPSDGSANLLVVPRCMGPGSPGVPADPPSAATIWQQTPLPRARPQGSPPGTPEWPGIVNLESRFWSVSLPETRATAVLDGYVVEVTAHPIAYAWSFGNGQTSVHGIADEQAAPARVTFRRRSGYWVTLHVVWAGVAHVTAPAFGLDLGVQDLGTVTLGEGMTHHVAEIRALLRSRSAVR